MLTTLAGRGNVPSRDNSPDRVRGRGQAENLIKAHKLHLASEYAGCCDLAAAGFPRLDGPWQLSLSGSDVVNERAIIALSGCGCAVNSTKFANATSIRADLLTC